MRILVPLDDSMQAQRVLAYVKVLAARSDGTLKLIRATDIEDETSFGSLEQNARRLEDAGCSVEWSVIGGVDAETAIHAAETEWKPDLIALASTKSSGLDRWLNGSVTERIVKTTGVPVLVVPPAWDRSITERGSARILVPLDGSAAAEQAVWVVVRLASLIPTHIVLVRAMRDDTTAQGAQEYLNQVAANVRSALSDGDVATHLVVNSPVSGILETAHDQDVDAIAMSTRGQRTTRRVSMGRVATEVFDRATVPLILLGPRALVEANPAQIKLGAQVRSLDAQRVGEVHRVVVDFDQQAIVSIVVLGRGGLGRDVLVPVDYIQSLGNDEVQLGLTREALDDLPDFAFNELVTPPATWTSSEGSALVRAQQHKRLGDAQHDLTRSTEVLATDGPIGSIQSVEWDPGTGRLIAVWARGKGVRGEDTRIKPEWVQRTDEDGNLQLTATRAELEGYLGHNGS